MSTVRAWCLSIALVGCMHTPIASRPLSEDESLALDVVQDHWRSLDLPSLGSSCDDERASLRIAVASSKDELWDACETSPEDRSSTHACFRRWHESLNPWDWHDAVIVLTVDPRAEIHMLFAHEATHFLGWCTGNEDHNHRDLSLWGVDGVALGAMRDIDSLAIGP